MVDIPEHLKLYDRDYFYGGLQKGISGYDNYAQARGVLEDWSGILERFFHPISVLDVGAAYGFVVEYFLKKGVPAVGIEPSEFARSQSRVPLLVGSLPVLPLPTDKRFDVVTATEVMEHIPEALVPASVDSLAYYTNRMLVLLVMLEGPGADGDAGHICLKSRSWWNELLDRTGLVCRPDLEKALDDHRYSRQMLWTGRFFVRERV